MSDDREQRQDVSDETQAIREHERQAREHAPDEAPPEERGEANTASEAADLHG